MSEVYENYRLISQRKTTSAGSPRLNIGIAGSPRPTTGRGRSRWYRADGEIFTVLGMTFEDTDLIQIQENVISRAIASLDFNVEIISRIHPIIPRLFRWCDSPWRRRAIHRFRWSFAVCRGRRWRAPSGSASLSGDFSRHISRKPRLAKDGGC